MLSEPNGERVSIPQSGFGAFEPERVKAVYQDPAGFQSLSRDSGRLNLYYTTSIAIAKYLAVSIPQSGFGAFEP